MTEPNGAPGEGGNPGDGGGEPTSFTIDEFKNGKWRDALSEEYGTHGSMSNFKTMDDFGKSYIHAQKMISSEKLPLPKDENDAEGWNNLFDKLGRPSDPDLYDLHKPEGAPEEWSNEGYQKYKVDFKKMAHENGLNSKQANQAWKFVQEKALAGHKGYTEAQKQQIDLMSDAAKKEFGDALLDKVSRRDAALNALGGEEAVNFIKNNHGLNSNPMIIKMFDKVADMLGEDKITDATIKKGGTTPSEAKSKINAILSDKNHPYKNKNHPDHANAVQEFYKLVEQAKKGD